MKGMSDQRSMDLGVVKHACLTYVPLDMQDKDQALVPSIPKTEDKSSRGFNHPQIARILCPRKRLSEFNTDPERFVCHVNNTVTNTL